MSDQNLICSYLEQSDQPRENTRNVFGKDDRIPVLSNKYPWSTIGRLESSGENDGLYICTGTLIGRDLVLTNAHCVVDEATGKIRSSLKFRAKAVCELSPDSASCPKR